MRDVSVCCRGVHDGYVCVCVICLLSGVYPMDVFFQCFLSVVFWTLQARTQCMCLADTIGRYFFFTSNERTKKTCSWMCFFLFFEVAVRAQWMCCEHQWMCCEHQWMCCEHQWMYCEHQWMTYVHVYVYVYAYVMYMYMYT